MNHKGNEFFSKVEKSQGIKTGRHLNCPVCNKEGTVQKDNFLIMEHRVDDDRRIVYHRWSYGSGRMIVINAEDYNVL
jgi:hypothetical protein